MRRWDVWRGGWPAGKWKLEWSFTASTAMLVVALIGATMLIVGSRLHATLRKDLETRGVSMARSIGAVATPSLLAYNYAALQIAAEAASQDTGVAYVVIHDKEGLIAGAAGWAAAPRPNSHALDPGPGPRPRVFDVRVASGGDRNEDVLEVAVPVYVAGVSRPWGTVRVGLSAEEMVGELRRTNAGLAALGLALGAAAAGAARWVARRITAPLRRLARGTEALSAGDMSHRIPITGAKELADLARAFNVMMERVQEKAIESQQFGHQLAELNATLEQQVRERTRELGESEAQYKSLVEHSPDAILILQDGRIRFVNPAFEAIFGVQRDRALSPEFDLLAIFEPASAQTVRERITAWELGEQAGPVEVEARAASGRINQLELRGSRIEYLGRPAAECLLIDTTEANELRERLAATEKLRSLGELAGGVAHDFNNLLGAILGRTQLLRTHSFDDRTDADLAIIEKAAQDGRETVRRIQEFSRVRQDRRFSTVQIADVMRDSVEITRSCWRADAESRNADINVWVDACPVPPVQGNASELREVFTNLILNAVDAMPQGGDLRLSCHQQGDDIVAEVADTGVGMTDSVRRQLFDPFFSTKGPRGMGLGLSMVYGIVTRHGGSIDVRTAPGKGTTFILAFPRAEEATTQEAGLEANGTGKVRPARILVIDDDPDIAELLRDVLAVHGHSVEVALSAPDGVSMATSRPFDLVYTDLGMPDMSGWEVADGIRAVKPELPVALLTGWAATIDESEVRSRGIAALVHKPFEINELLEVTARLLAGSAAPAKDSSIPQPV